MDPATGLPVVDEEKCTACGICAKACPMGSIDPEAKFEATGICIKCQACIKKCPTGAKTFADPAFLSHRQMLMENFAAERKEPCSFIACNKRLGPSPKNFSSR